MGTIIHRQAVAIVTSLCVLSSSVFAATTVGLPPNRYSPRDDVGIGRKAAAEARRERPMVRDAQVQRYVTGLGQRLVSVVPSRLRHSGFRYSFETVNQRGINAFALPGGPMFVNRGVLEAARSEGQVAGVMAHELAHVVLRHGTAQATEGQKFRAGCSRRGRFSGWIVRRRRRHRHRTGVEHRPEHLFHRRNPAVNMSVRPTSSARS